MRELLPFPEQNPFHILCGTSAGAINAAFLANHRSNFGQAAHELSSLWNALSTEEVLRGTPLELAKIRTEERLAATSMRSVVVRPDAFQEIHLGPLGRFDVAKGKASWPSVGLVL